MNMKLNSEIKVLLVDGHQILREGVKTLLEASGGIRIVASAGTAEEAWAKMENRTLDIVITDLCLPARSGLWLIEKIAKERAALRVLVLSMPGCPEDVLRALKAGAAGYLTKNTSVEELEAAVRSVCQGGSYLQPSIASLVVASLQNPVQQKPTQKLPPRAKKLLQCLAEGLSNKDIAEQLIVSVSTVKTQLRSLFAKFGVSSRTELIVAALKDGLIEDESNSQNGPLLGRKLSVASYSVA